ncbi:MAG: ABC transporter permease [Chloroflexota bacterium]|nr:ABC transporter permease [Chloroflexota bacterium]
MSRDFLTVFLYELRRNFRRRGYLFASFGVPVLAVIGLYIYQAVALNDLTNPSPAAPVINAIDEDLGMDGLTSAGVVDQAGIDPIIPDGYAELLTLYPSIDAANAALAATTIQAYYVIQPDYLDTGAVEIVLPGLALAQITTTPIEAVLQNTITRDLSVELRARLINPANFRITNIELTSVGAGSEEEVFSGATLVGYVFAIALTFSLFMTNGYLLQTVIEEKETRLVEILIASVKPGDLLGGKILAMGLLGLFQVTAWVVMVFAGVALAAGSAASQTVGLLSTLANIQLSAGILPLLALYFVLAYLLFAGLYAIVGALSNSMREGPQYAVFFTLPSLFPLYFISQFTSDPNGSLAVGMSLFPLTAPIAMVIRLTLTNVPLLEIVISAGLLAATVVGVMWLAGRVFRVGLLLAGKLPKLREIPMLLRG